MNSTVTAMPEVSGWTTPSTVIVSTSGLSTDREHEVLRALSAAEAGRIRHAGRVALDRIGVGLGDRVPGDARDMSLDRARNG